MNNQLINALSDCVSVMERELSGLAVIQPELKAAREALAAASAAPTAWSGEGLPPVGMVCEFLDRNTNRWLPVEIVFLSSWVVVVRDTNEHPDGAVDLAFDLNDVHPQFRPARTHEQIAAEERLDRVHAIEGIMLRGQELALTITQIAVAIDDAGYHKDHRTADLLRALREISTASDQSTVIGLKQLAASTLAAVEGGAA